MSILRPSFPGYFPAMLVAVRSNKFAPVSLHIACTNILLPVPLGPANIKDFTSGDFSCTPGEPALVKSNAVNGQELIFSLFSYF